MEFRANSWKMMKGLMVVLAIAMAALGLGSTARGDSPAPIVEPLGRGTFTDEVSGHIKAKADGHGTIVSNFSDASDAVFARITIPVGARTPWHTHSGPALVVNTGAGTLTSAITDDCLAVEYPPGTAFLDPGQGVPHGAVNNSDADVVLYAIFLEVETGPVLPDDAPEQCDL